MEGKVRWQDRVNLVLGLWLMLSPYLLGYAGNGSATANATAAGAVVTLFAVAALWRPQHWEEWTNLGVSLWIIVAPFLLGFWDVPAAAWTHMATGLLVGGDALWAMQNQFREPV